MKKTILILALLAATALTTNAQDFQFFETEKTIERYNNCQVNCARQQIAFYDKCVQMKESDCFDRALVFTSHCRNVCSPEFYWDYIHTVYGGWENVENAIKKGEFPF